MWRQWLSLRRLHRPFSDSRRGQNVGFRTYNSKMFPGLYARPLDPRNVLFYAWEPENALKRTTTFHFSVLKNPKLFFSGKGAQPLPQTPPRRVGVHPSHITAHLLLYFKLLPMPLYHNLSTDDLMRKFWYSICTVLSCKICGPFFSKNGICSGFFFRYPLFRQHFCLYRSPKHITHFHCHFQPQNHACSTGPLGYTSQISYRICEHLTCGRCGVCGGSFAKIFRQKYSTLHFVG